MARSGMQKLALEAQFLESVGHAGWGSLAQQWAKAMAAKRRAEMIAWAKFHRDAHTLVIRCLQ